MKWIWDNTTNHSSSESTTSLLKDCFISSKFICIKNLNENRKEWFPYSFYMQIYLKFISFWYWFIKTNLTKQQKQVWGSIIPVIICNPLKICRCSYNWLDAGTITVAPIIGLLLNASPTAPRKVSPAFCAITSDTINEITTTKLNFRFISFILN